MQKTLINQHKREDVFRCAHQSHFKFEKNVSVHHVLQEKKCFPQGCVYFQWKCTLLNKGTGCPKKYKHVGKSCFSCKYYFEEKLNYQPEVLLSETEFKTFQRELEDYEHWLAGLLGKMVDLGGVVNSIVPHFIKNILYKKEQMSFLGFLLSFREGYIDRVFFQDYFYLNIPAKIYRDYHLFPGDKIDFRAKLKTDRGRIVFHSPKEIEITRNESVETSSNSFRWDPGEALVASKTGTEFDVQPEKCFACDKGILLDISEEDTRRKRNYRHLFCLQGIENPENCIYDLRKKLRCPDSAEPE